MAEKLTGLPRPEWSPVAWKIGSNPQGLGEGEGQLVGGCTEGVGVSL